MFEPAKETKTNPPFEDHVRSTVLALRGALADLLDGLGEDPTRPQEMSRRFGLNKNLAWKLSRMVCEADPCAAIPHIPGKSGLNILIRAFEKAGAGEGAVRTLRRVIREFDAMAALHAGDRTTLEMMAGHLTRAGEDQRNEAYRKLSYQGNSAIWGVQARAQLTVNVIAPGEDPDRVDLAWLCGLVDLRRLRQDVPWAVASARKFETDGKEIPVGAIEPIDPDHAGPDEAPLMGAFCSKPLPPIRPVPQSEGMLRYELVGGPVGNTAAATAIVGLFGRSFITRYRYDSNILGEHIARMSTPAESLVHDLFVHRSLTYAHDPGITLYSQLPGGPVYPTAGRDSGLLPLSDRVHALGAGLAAAAAPEIPRYKKLLETVYRRLGWDPGEFLGFRFRLRYPPVPALAVLRYELPEKR